MRGLDQWLTDDSTPASRAHEAWTGRATVGDACEIIGRHTGDDDGRPQRGGNVSGSILEIRNDRVIVRGDDGLTYTLDWSDVGPVTGY